MDEISVLSIVRETYMKMSMNSPVQIRKLITIFKIILKNEATTHIVGFPFKINLNYVCRWVNVYLF